MIHNRDLPEPESIHGGQHTCRSHCENWVYDLTRGLPSKRLPVCNQRVFFVLDFSCVNAVQQVTTFGPPEGGTKDSLNVIYDCSYHLQDRQQLPQKTSAPVANSVEPSRLYMKQMAERLRQSFSDYERVDANVPAGNSAEMWFDVNRDGSLSNIRIGKPSGWNSLATHAHAPFSALGRLAHCRRITSDALSPRALPVPITAAMPYQHPRQLIPRPAGRICM